MKIKVGKLYRIARVSSRDGWTVLGTMEKILVPIGAIVMPLEGWEVNGAGFLKVLYEERVVTLYCPGNCFPIYMIPLDVDSRENME